MADWGKESDFDRQLYRLGVSLAGLREEFYSDPRPVDILFRKAQEDETPAQVDLSQFGGKPIAVGTRWAHDRWERGLFLARVTVPADFAGRQVVLRMDVGAEAVAFRDGIPIQGLDANRDDLVLTVQARGSEEYCFLVEAVSVTAFGKETASVLKRAEVCVYNPEMYALYYDFQMIHSLAKALGREDPWARRLLYEANNAVDVWRDEWSTPQPRARARKAREILAPLYEHKASNAWPEAYLSGHAHIDVAWLWPLEETVRKCSRSFSSVVRYLAEYPEFRFTQTQAALYQMTKENFPSLYQSISEMVAEGRWEPAGGMWVESDCNMTGAEAMVRQFLYGKKFFQEEFGTESDVCWLPDTFGFPPSMPQILKKCGIDFFASAKIGWNLYTEFPYNTFQWKGIDGTELLTHLIVPGNYNILVFPDQLVEAARKFSEADRSPAFFLSFGYGDGGGGPTRGQIERCRRARELFGLPRTRMSSLSEFFHRIRDASRNLPTHRGELYLELHRGTLTSQARTKRNNRMAELTLRRLEILLSMLKVLGTDLNRKDEIDTLWKTLLTLQFHDVLPGSSISWVYEDAEKLYAELFEKARSLEAEAVGKLEDFVDSRIEGTPFLVFNFLSWDRCGLIELPLENDGKPYHAVSFDGTPLPCQQVEHESGGRSLLVEMPEVPPLGYTVVSLKQGTTPVERADVKASGNRTLANEVLRVKLDKNGWMESLFDRRVGAEVLKEGQKGNQLNLYSDLPARWEAWDIDEDFERVGTDLKALSLETTETGPLRASIKATYEFGDSVLVQETRLYSHLPWVEFNTWCDWKERKKLLKAAFPLSIDPAFATYEIQFGAHERPTSRNNPLERGRFEVAAHRWADLSLPHYGVSLLNNCKYGHDISNGTMRLSLLRGPETPDPSADLGEHSFAYAVYPHKGDWRGARTARAGFEFNVPLAAYAVSGSGGTLPPAASFVSVDAENVIIEVLKPSEDGNSVVVRSYECNGETAKASFAFDAPIEKVEDTDLLEKGGEALPATETSFDTTFRPYDIRTFKVTFA